MKKLMMTAAVGAIVLTACNKEPEVSFTADKTTVKRGEAVTFTNSSLEKKVYDFEWTFGDGSEPAHTYNAAHTYSSEGAYVVTLSGASKKRNKFATATATVNVTHEWVGTLPQAQIDQNNDRAYSEARTKWYNSRVGVWKTSVVSKNEPSCSGGSGVSRSGNGDALNVTFEFLQNGSTIVRDHHGNINSGGSWSYVDDTHISISGLSNVDFPYEVDGTTGVEKTFSLIDGIYTITAGSMDFVRTVKVSSVNGTAKCVNTNVYTLTLVKQ